MREPLFVQSHTGPYGVHFESPVPRDLAARFPGNSHFLVDANVARLHRSALATILGDQRTLQIEATEENKSIERVIDVIRRLVDNGIRRDHRIVAVGGGIVQDIACFISSTLFRGVPWAFVPTTLLAQADSCIGSKSSINLGAVKNILGTFNPPSDVIVADAFLDTLEAKDVHSGIGEILKVHAIDGPGSFDALAHDFDALFTDRDVLGRYVYAALRIKQRFIEVDEFDRGPRMVFNYGHSFGHAIESATKFAVPHGIAVTMGMEIANRIAALRGVVPEAHHQRMRPTLVKNYRSYADTPIAADALLSALGKDKKNSSERLVLILPVGPDAKVSRTEVPNDAAFRGQLEDALSELRT